MILKKTTLIILISILTLILFNFCNDNAKNDTDTKNTSIENQSSVENEEIKPPLFLESSEKYIESSGPIPDWMKTKSETSVIGGKEYKSIYGFASDEELEKAKIKAENQAKQNYIKKNELDIKIEEINQLEVKLMRAGSYWELIKKSLKEKVYRVMVRLIIIEK